MQEFEAVLETMILYWKDEDSQEEQAVMCTVLAVIYEFGEVRVPLIGLTSELHDA